MGRYSSVQAYADTNANMRSVPYEQAAGTSNAAAAAPKSGGGAKPEKVVNPYGSTAGAGSGEFHVYRHARAREMQRLQNMDNEEQQELLDQQFKNQVQEYHLQEEGKTEKRRKKRQRQKEAKMRKKNLKLAGVDSSEQAEETTVQVDQDEFTYVPEKEQASTTSTTNEEEEEEEEKNESEEATKKIVESNKKETTSNDELPFANDGSFLEQMKKRMEAEKESKQQQDDDDGDDGEDGRPTKKQEL